jgi:hypothetical protein
LISEMVSIFINKSLNCPIPNPCPNKLLFIHKFEPAFSAWKARIYQPRAKFREERTETPLWERDAGEKTSAGFDEQSQ